MNINKFTQKSIEAVNQCEKVAYEYGNQEIDQEHFLYSLMTIEDSLIANLIEKMDIDKDTFIKNIETLLSQKNKYQAMCSYISAMILIRCLLMQRMKLKEWEMLMFLLNI